MAARGSGRALGTATTIASGQAQALGAHSWSGWPRVSRPGLIWQIWGLRQVAGVSPPAQGPLAEVGRLWRSECDRRGGPGGSPGAAAGSCSCIARARDRGHRMCCGRASFPNLVRMQCQLCSGQQPARPDSCTVTPSQGYLGSQLESREECHGDLAPLLLTRSLHAVQPVLHLPPLCKHQRPGCSLRPGVEISQILQVCPWGASTNQIAATAHKGGHTSSNAPGQSGEWRSSNQ